MESDLEEPRPLRFVGSAAKDMRALPREVRRVFGYDLHAIQCGKTPPGAKKLKGLPGVMELVKRHDTDTYRAAYVANIGGMVYVLHCFKKKSKRGIGTPREDVNLIRSRLQLAHEDNKGRLS